MCPDKVTEQSGHHRASQGIGDEKGHVNFAARKRRLQKLGGSLTPNPSPKGEGRKASPPTPLQGERGGSKLKGCDGQDRGIQTISVKSVGIKIKSSLQIYPTNVFHKNGGTFVGLVGLVFYEFMNKCSNYSNHSNHSNYSNYSNYSNHSNHLNYSNHSNYRTTRYFLILYI